jgi:hypothetical protein
MYDQREHSTNAGNYSSRCSAVAAPCGTWASQEGSLDD